MEKPIVKVIVSGPNIESIRYFTSDQKCNRFLRLIRKHYSEKETKINIESLIRN